MANQFTKAEVARQYRDKYGIEMPTMKLARIMYKDNNILFSNVESARSALRSIEGKNGKGNNYKKTHVYGERKKNPYNFPESDEREWLPFKITGVERLGIISDVHLNYHSISALTCTFDYFIQKNIDCLLLNGDILDAYQLSKFVRDPKKRGFADELHIFEQFIKTIRQAFGDIRIIFKLGNHEERYDHFLMTKAHELSGVSEFSIEQLINNRAPGVEIVKDKRIIHANDLDIIHGHEFAQSVFSPVNIARGLQLRAKTNAIQGHNHISSEHTEPNLRGGIKTTWSMGCLCELHPEYMPINKWNHGCSYIELSNNSNEFHVDNKRIYNGKML